MINWLMNWLFSDKLESSDVIDSYGYTYKDWIKYKTMKYIISDPADECESIFDNN